MTPERPDEGTMNAAEDMLRENGYGHVWEYLAALDEAQVRKEIAAKVQAAMDRRAEEMRERARVAGTITDEDRRAYHLLTGRPLSRIEAITVLPPGLVYCRPVPEPPPPDPAG